MTVGTYLGQTNVSRQFETCCGIHSKSAGDWRMRDPLKGSSFVPSFRNLWDPRIRHRWCGLVGQMTVRLYSRPMCPIISKLVGIHSKSAGDWRMVAPNCEYATLSMRRHSATFLRTEPVAGRNMIGAKVCQIRRCAHRRFRQPCIPYNPFREQPPSHFCTMPPQHSKFSV